MTRELRTAIAELVFAWGEVQAEAARYEGEGTMATASALARRMDRLVSQVSVVKQALRADVKRVPLPVTQVTDDMVGAALTELHGEVSADAIRAALEIGLGLRDPRMKEAA